MKKICTLLLCAGMFQPMYAQEYKLVETVKAEQGKLVIPYTRYQLKNGLNVIVHEDHSDPIVHVDVTYHVGSAREEIGKSGFAHFFEHMMFQGSDNVADEQHFKIITEAGGTLNGTTNRDRTNYFETVPANQLEKMLWLEADRMGFLLDAVTQQKFEVQRATVKNERGQNYDNRPYGLAGEVKSKNLYPYGHPYSWLTIGYIEDLNRVNVDDLKNFFLRWYGPNNATITVGGDVKSEEVLNLVIKYFGSIPRGPEVMPTVLPAVQLTSDRYVSYMDNYAKLPMLSIVYPTVRGYDKDEAALDCLAEILGQGKNSVFYQNMIKTQKAVNANASHPASELAGEFSISIIPYAGQKLSDMEALYRKSLTDFEARGVTDDDVLKFKNKHEADLISGLESVAGKVSQLASSMTFRTNPNTLNQDLMRYNAVTKEDVMRVYNQYIKGKPAVYLSVLTKGNEENRAKPDNYTVSESGYVAPDYGYQGLKYNKAKDNFDRSKIPAAGANPIVQVPKIWKKDVMANVKSIGTISNELPVTSIYLSFKGGQLLEPNQKAGLASMFADMMEEDTKNKTAEEIESELDKLGSRISISAGLDEIGVQVYSLTKNLAPTMKVLQERLLHPKFTDDDFNRLQKRGIEGYKNALNQPAYVASKLYDRILFGSNSTLGNLRTDKTLEAITLADIENYYKNNFSTHSAKVVVVSDLSSEEVLPLLSFLNQLPSNAINVTKPANATPASKTTIYFVDVPNAAQTEFRIGNTSALRYDVLGNYFKSGIMNYPLGGAFNSRLNLILREEKGWTYGARSGFSADEYAGRYVFSAGIKSNATDSALDVVLNKMKTYKEQGITADELKFTQMSMGQSDARKYETSGQKASFLYRMLKYNLGTDFPEKQNKMLNGMKVADINALAQTYVPNNQALNILLVGDKAKNMEKLKRFGYPIVEIDKEGNKK